MDQSARGHRRFAMLVFLSIAGLMPGIAGAAAPAAEKLQVLVNDTAAQLQLAYRRHPEERALRQEQLSAAVAAWRAAPRNEANNERLANWLRAAIVSSMPGSTEPLPAIPSFAAVVKVEPQPEVREAPAQPQTVEKQPTIVEKQPEPVESKPTTIEKQPEAAEKQPTTVEKNSEAVEKQPTVVEKQPEAVEKAIEKQAPVEAVAKPARDGQDDPFRDDPVSDSEQK